MKDEGKTKQQLIDELEQLRGQLGEQSRHLTTERAVQQVRAEAASMRRSADLGEVILTLQDGLSEAGLRFMFASINIVDEQAGTFCCYRIREYEDVPKEMYQDKAVADEIRPGMYLECSASVPLELAREQGWAQPGLEADFWTTKESFPEAVRQLWGRDFPSDSMVGWHGLSVPFSHGGVFAFALEGAKYEQEDLELVERFADAVSLGYTRFLDLQAAEERNRQLVSESAAESVRAEAMAMRKADDIAHLVAALCRGLQACGLPFDACIIQLADEELDVLRLNNALRSDYDLLIQSGFPIEKIVQKDLAEGIHLVTTDIPLPFAREHGYAIRGFEPSILVQPDSFVDDMKALWSWPDVHEGWAGSYGLNVPFDFGGIYVSVLRGTVYTEPDLKLVEQFAEAVSLGYARYFDIRTAEEAQQKLIAEMEEELQTAHEMQMNLMPEGSPDLEGVSITAHCSTANRVGGDFYQYFGDEDRLTISLADVTGHSMEAAIPAVMFSGILDNQMEQPRPLPELYQSLNRSLCRSLGEHTYICLTMLDLDPGARLMKVANCGCPYPLHYHQAGRKIEEIQIEAYPLGIRPDTEYAAKEVALEPGDYVILHSDGFSESTNAETQLFGFDRTTEVIRQGCSEGLSPEDLIERLIAEVKAFTGDEPQADDMTCVVIKVEA